MLGEENHEYDDMLDLPHHVSANRPHMSAHDRAAQFAPFAALTGHGEAIRETERLTESERILDEDSMDILERKFEALSAHLGEDPTVKISYYQPDDRKEGGAYLTVSGRIKKIRKNERILILEDGTEIPFGRIVDIVDIERG